MRPITQQQKELLDLVRENPGLNTSSLRGLMGDRQAYETYLRDRLFRLADRGLVRYEEKRSKIDPSVVLERKWWAVEKTYEVCK